MSQAPASLPALTKHLMRMYLKMPEGDILRRGIYLQYLWISQLGLFILSILIILNSKITNLYQNKKQPFSHFFLSSQFYFHRPIHFNIILLMKTKKAQYSEQSIITVPPSELFQSGFNERTWLKSHGKQEYISFSDKALVELRKYFNSLDLNNNGSIGVEELEDPFIAFGLSDSREQVEELIKSVDLDGSGKIQFDEFLQIMLKIKRGKSGGAKNSAMFDFFQRMSTGKLGQQFDRDMPFRLNVSQFRRKRLLQSMMGQNKEKKQKGTKILQNFKRQVINHPGLRQTLSESKKGTNFLLGFDAKPSKH